MNFLIVCLAFLAVVGALRHDEPEEIARRMAARRKAHQGRKLIVGGQTINQARYPYYTLVEIEYANDEVFFCGGALVNAGCVLTSASCIGDAAISVAIGANYTTDAGFTGNEQFRSISNTVIHPQYSATTSDYDLALLFFDLPITSIQPIQVNPSRPANGAALRVIGFGVIDEVSLEYPLVLQQGDVNVVPPGDCNDANSYNGEIRSTRMLCAIGNGVNACDGDGGGPLIVVGASPTEDGLVGAVSFGTGCTDSNFPGVYTRLSFFIQYIEDQICLFSSLRPVSCPSLAPSSSPTITGAPTGPTSSPAPSASPAPSLEPTRKKGGGFCFSGENTVETEDGVVRMDELQLGDRILSGENNFEEVYSFGHFSEEVESEYLQVFTEGAKQPLELSADHMLFLENDAAVAAADVSVGDKVLLANGEVRVVESVESVTRQGVYAPFTESGTVSVNGVKASSFVAFQDESFQTPFSDHVAAHMSQLPQRVLARFGITCNSFNAAGVNGCLEPLMNMHESFRALPSFLLAPFIAVLALLYGVEQYPLSFMALVGGVFLYRSVSSRKVKQA